MQRLALVVGLPPSDLTIDKMILTQCAVCATELGLIIGQEMRPLQHALLRRLNARCSTGKKAAMTKLCKKIKKAGGAEQYNANKKYTEAVAVASGGVRGGHEGPDVLHLHAGPPLENEGGPRARLRVPRDGGPRARVVLGGAGEDFGRGGRGEQFGHTRCNERFARWFACSLCEQQCHGVVCCALGWACWKTYVGRPEVDSARLAMRQLGNGLSEAKHHEDAASVREAELAMLRRLGGSEDDILITCRAILRSRMMRLDGLKRPYACGEDVYSRRLKLSGEEHERPSEQPTTTRASLLKVERFEEAKSVLRKTIPVARRVLGEDSDHTLRMRRIYATALYKDPAATLDDLREAVTTLEETDRRARRVLGGAHPLVAGMQVDCKRREPRSAPERHQRPRIKTSRHPSTAPRRPRPRAPPSAKGNDGL